MLSISFECKTMKKPLHSTITVNRIPYYLLRKICVKMTKTTRTIQFHPSLEARQPALKESHCIMTHVLPAKHGPWANCLLLLLLVCAIVGVLTLEALRVGRW